jgi:hypothetical protein
VKTLGPDDANWDVIASFLPQGEPPDSNCPPRLLAHPLSWTLAWPETALDPSSCNIKVDFAPVPQGANDAGLFEDVVRATAGPVGPYQLVSYSLSGRGRSAFDLPDFEPLTLAEGDTAAFDIRLDVSQPPGIYEATVYINARDLSGTTLGPHGFTFDVRAEIVPEPSGAVLLLVGLVGLRRRRRRQSHNPHAENQNRTLLRS